MELLNVLEAADFNWAKHIDKVWSDDVTDVAGIHLDVRKDFNKTLAKLARQDDSASPLGWVVNGPGGSGKTHLLGAFRRETLEKGGFFIIADMSGVKDFWETILLHLVRSIRTAGPDGKPQTLRLLEKIAKVSGCDVDSDSIPGMFRDDLAAAIKKIINGLYRLFDVQTQEFQDVLRAAVMLTSEDIDISDCGRQWLQGLEVDGEAIKPFGFKRQVCDAKNAVAGMSWLMSLDNGFSVFALDQLDAIIKQHYNPDADLTSEEAATARHIIVGICDGLMTLRDITRRTLIVVSCLNDSWSYLSEFGLKTAVDRYQSPIRLSSLNLKSQVEELVAARMTKAFEKEKMNAPYATWPFPSAVLGGMTDLSPRIVLQRCDHHIRNCLTEGAVREAAAQMENEPEVVIASEVSALQKRIDLVGLRYRQEFEFAKSADFKKLKRADAFWHAALACFARAFRLEQPPMPTADLMLDDDEYADSKYPLLHAKLRFETMAGNTRDRHLSFRALLHPNAIAFQTRLKAAITQSGIDRNLSFRKLILVHFDSFPSGKVTNELLNKFTTSGGIWITPTDEVIRHFIATAKMEMEFPADWAEWVKQTKPTKNINFARDELKWLIGGQPEAVNQPEANPLMTNQAPTSYSQSQSTRKNTEVIAEVVVEKPEMPVSVIASAPVIKTRSVGDAQARISVGKKTASALAGSQGAEVTLSLETLKRHIAILAGSGSGKTVLTRRLVEEAALCGTPAVVIDIANDLARLGQPWPEEPDAWTAEDKDKAKRYFDKVEVKIWTPGKSAGNPLRLRKIPDLAAGDIRGQYMYLG